MSNEKNLSEILDDKAILDDINSFKEEETVVNKKTKRKKTNNILNFTKNDIVKGIILSEVLGPPKGRKR